jgi:type I restriction enzyme R subunit
MTPPSHCEERISQIPALQVLVKLGYEYLTPAEADELRGGRRRLPVLTGVLGPWLAANNAVRYRGETLPFSEGNLNSALRRITDILFAGLITANEKVYETLTLGIRER